MKALMLKSSVLGLAFALGAAGCSGGGGDASDTTPPTVVSTTPGSGAAEVACNVAVTVVFSERMGGATLHGGTFRLTDSSGRSIPGTVTYSGDTTACFVPASLLTPLRTYTATVTTEARDAAGNGLQAPVSWSFTTRYREKVWEGPALIETAEEDSYDPGVAMSGDGSAMAVWSQWDGRRTSIRASRYFLEMGWETAAVIESGAGSAFFPEVAMDNAGHAMAVWEQSDGTRIRIWANRYSPGASWEGASLVGADGTGDAHAPQVAMNGSGHAVAVWEQSDGTGIRIRANRYSPQTGWGAAAAIEIGDGDAREPRIAICGDGSAIAVWSRWDEAGQRHGIRASRYTPGAGWEAAVPIDGGTGDAHAPQVAMDGAGNAMAVWAMSDGIRSGIRASRYTPGAGWETAAAVETGEGDAGCPEVAMKGTGEAVVAWSQFDGARFGIRARPYAPGTGWGTAAVVETGAGNASNPELAMSASGDAVAAWVTFDGTRNNVWASRYDPDTGWGAAALMESGEGDVPSTPRVAADEAGNAVAVWTQYEGARQSVWASVLR